MGSFADMIIVSSDTVVISLMAIRVNIVPPPLPYKESHSRPPKRDAGLGLHAGLWPEVNHLL